MKLPTFDARDRAAAGALLAVEDDDGETLRRLPRYEHASKLDRAVVVGRGRSSGKAVCRCRI
jgi:hypothetical protein